MRVVVWIIANVAALGFATWLFDGITLTGSDDTERIGTLVLVGAIFGVITAVVKPVVTFVSFCLIVLTLGLMLLVINALMLLLTSKVAGAVGLGFHVEGFWTAVGASIVISLVAALVGALLPKPPPRSLEA